MNKVFALLVVVAMFFPVSAYAGEGHHANAAPGTIIKVVGNMTDGWEVSYADGTSEILPSSTRMERRCDGRALCEAKVGYLTYWLYMTKRVINQHHGDNDNTGSGHHPLSARTARYCERYPNDCPRTIINVRGSEDRGFRITWNTGEVNNVITNCDHLSKREERFCEADVRISLSFLGQLKTIINQHHG